MERDPRGQEKPLTLATFLFLSSSSCQGMALLHAPSSFLIPVYKSHIPLYGKVDSMPAFQGSHFLKMVWINASSTAFDYSITQTSFLENFKHLSNTIDKETIYCLKWYELRFCKIICTLHEGQDINWGMK